MPFSFEGCTSANSQPYYDLNFYSLNCVFKLEFKIKSFFQIPKISQNEFQNLKIFKTRILGIYGTTTTYACPLGGNIWLWQTFYSIYCKAVEPKMQVLKIFRIWNSFWIIFGIWKIFGFWIPFWNHNSNYRSLGH